MLTLLSELLAISASLQMHFASVLLNWELFFFKLTLLSKGVQFGHNRLSQSSKTDFTKTHCKINCGFIQYFNMVKTSQEDKNSSSLNAFISVTIGGRDKTSSSEIITTRTVIFVYLDFI